MRDIRLIWAAARLIAVAVDAVLRDRYEWEVRP